MTSHRIRQGVALAALLSAPAIAAAFHSGGVAECGGCHSMHAAPAGGSFLLLGSDPSSTCLGCHEHAGDTGPSGYHVSTAESDMPAGTAPVQRTPGGDFGWLKKTYVAVIRGSTVTEEGESHGHNVVAADYSYAVDRRNAAAPGGTYPSIQLGCNSCHDPHGRFRRGTGDVVTTGGQPIRTSGSYDAAGNEPGVAPDGSAFAVGVYRLLAGAGYTKSGVVPAYPGVPPAKVRSDYNRSEATGSTRVAYGVVATAGNTTWGNWCGTCHPGMHSMTNYVHPVDQSLGSTVAGRYNAYVKSGRMTGTQATAFTSLVPFVTNGTGNTYARLSTVSTTTAGPVSSDKVTCLSCHRAHASGWRFALRWNLDGELLTWDGAYPDGATHPQLARGRTQGEIAAAYYDRPPTAFAAYQRALCNKCHAKD